MAGLQRGSRVVSEAHVPRGVCRFWAWSVKFTSCFDTSVSETKGMQPLLKWKLQTPRTKTQFPTPNVPRAAIVPRRRPNPKFRASDLRPQTPSSDPRPQTPDLRAQTSEPRPQNPDLRTRTSDTNARTPEHQCHDPGAAA